MLSERIKNMAPSITLELTAKVAELQKQGIDIINFTVGEPDFNTPAHVIEAAKKAMDEGHTKYTAVPGIIELRKAICQKLIRENRVTYEPSQIVVSAGAKQALFNGLMTLCNPGDEVILPVPCWVSYVELIKLAGGVPVFVSTTQESGFQLDVLEIKRVITPKTKAILINSPNNPTGAVYSRETLEQLAELAKVHDFYVIADEIYEKLVYGKSEFVCFASLSQDAYERTITVNGFSKAYAMTGWRLGYTASNVMLAKGMGALQSHTTSNANTIAQYAALQALEGPQEMIKEMHDAFDERRNYLLDRLGQIQGVRCTTVEGAFYLMPDISDYFGKSDGGRWIQNAVDLCEWLLETAHISLVPGDAFEYPGTVRFSYSIGMGQIEEGCNRFEKALKLLK